MFSLNNASGVRDKKLQCCCPAKRRTSSFGPRRSVRKLADVGSATGCCHKTHPVNWLGVVGELRWGDGHPSRFPKVKWGELVSWRTGAPERQAETSGRGVFGHFYSTLRRSMI